MLNKQHIPGISNNDLAIQNWAFTTKGSHSISIDRLVTMVLDKCNVDFECDCTKIICEEDSKQSNDGKETSNKVSNDQILNSLQAVMMLIQNLTSRVETIEEKNK